MRPEERLQRAIARRLDAALRPDVFWYAVDKGVFFGGGEADKLRRIRAAAAQKAMGVRNGILDLHFFWPGRNYITIDLKWGKNTPAVEQLQTARKIVACGFASGFAWSATELETKMRAAGVPMVGSFGAIVDQMLAVDAPAPKKAAAKPRKQAVGVSARQKKFAAAVYTP